MLLELASRVIPGTSSGAKMRALAQMAKTVGEISRISNRLLRSSMEGAQKSTLQRTRILDVVAMGERIRSFAEKTGVNSREAASRTEAVARDADQGSDMIAETTRNMQSLAETVSESEALMQHFVQRVYEVNSMVTTIGDIARQTNLLALNAAIEAANAGEKGDGFSVIAHEIRLLADRTSASTNEIRSRIELMSSSARVAESAMSKSKQAVEVSIEQSQNVQLSFQRLRDAMHRINSMSAEVALASEKQIASVARVTESVKKIDDLALGCTYEADASAEMSMRMVSCARSLREGLMQVNVSLPKLDEDAERATNDLIEKIQIHQPQVERALQTLRAQCAASGDAAVEHSESDTAPQVPTLRFGLIDAANATQWLDAISETSGCGATIFVRHDDQFIRVATTVKRSDGSRATGTALNPRGIAAQKLLSRKSHHGAAYILGKPFLAAYEPVESAAGELIGALYVGYSLA